MGAAIVLPAERHQPAWQSGFCLVQRLQHGDRRLDEGRLRLLARKAQHVGALQHENATQERIHRTHVAH